MAKGDLTKKFQMNAAGDIKVMADGLNTAIDNLNELLFNIGHSTDVVNSNAMQMLNRSEGMKRNATEVSKAISEMAKGAQSQASRTDESSKLVDKVFQSSISWSKEPAALIKLPSADKEAAKLD
jgi:methyl-accepting chemotaxis protein